MRPHFAFLPLLFLLLLAAPKESTPCYVDVGASHYYTELTEASPSEALSRLGLTRGPEDRVLSATRDGTLYVRLERAQSVRVRLPDGEIRMLTGYGERVDALLAREGLAPREGERLNCDGSLQTFDGMQIELCSRTTQTVRNTVVLPAKTVRLESFALAPGEQRLLCPGKAGSVERVYAVTSENGTQTERVLLAEQVRQAPRLRILLVGADRGIELRRARAVSSAAGQTAAGQTAAGQTAAGGTFVTAGGETLTYSRALQCIATAYSCEGYTGITATGTVARVGAIAVDPSFIPYGTRMYIVSNDGQYIYGYAVAEDTGGFSGNRIDLYFDTVDACWQFGRRSCTVYILN